MVAFFACARGTSKPDRVSLGEGSHCCLAAAGAAARAQLAKNLVKDPPCRPNGESTTHERLVTAEFTDPDSNLRPQNHYHERSNNWARQAAPKSPAVVYVCERCRKDANQCSENPSSTTGGFGAPQAIFGAFRPRELVVSGRHPTDLQARNAACGGKYGTPPNGC